MLSEQPGWDFQIRDGVLWAQSPPVPDVTRPGSTRVTGHVEIRSGDDYAVLRAGLIAAIDAHEARELAGETVHPDPADRYAIGEIIQDPSPVTVKGPGLSPVQAIPGRAPVPSVLTAGRNRTGDGFGMPGHGGLASWVSGISWRSTQSLVEYGREMCGSGDLESAPEIEKPEFYPYWLYVPYSCDWVLPVDMVTPEGDTMTVGSYRADATGSLDSMTAWGISNELWTGAIEALNPSLMNTAMDISFPTAIHPVEALGILLTAYSECTQEGGAVIHAPIPALVALLAHGVVRQQGDVYYGPIGSVISPGPGYPVDQGLSSDIADGPDSADDPAAGAGNVWMYVTGPIEYALGDIVVYPDGDESFYDPRKNRYEVTAQREVIHRFDTHCVFAMRVFIPSPTVAEET